MAKSVLIPLDFNQLEIQNAALQNLASDPGSPVAGQIWFNTNVSYPKVYDGAADIVLKGAGHSLDEFAAAAAAVDMGSNLVNNVTDPSSAQDAATKNYVDGAVSGAIEVQDDGATISADVDLLDFAGGYFDVTEPVAGEAEIQFTNDSMTFTGGNGIAALGSVALGGSLTFGLASGGVQTDELDLTITPSWSGKHTFGSGLDAGSNIITSVADPTNAQDAATKNYVDGLEQGLDVKGSVVGASDGTNFDLTGTTTVTVDGITLADGDRILLKDQTTASENGIYVCDDATNPGYPSNWVRATDADEDSEVTAGLYSWTEEGTNNADTGFILTTNDPITVGTTDLTFTAFTSAGKITAGDGLTKSGNTVNAVGGNGITANPDSLDAALDKYSTLIGDGTATTITVNHALGTRDVEVAIREAGSPYAFVDAQVEAVDTNNVECIFATAPGTDAYSAVVVG